MFLRNIFFITILISINYINASEASNEVLNFLGRECIEENQKLFYLSKLLWLNNLTFVDLTKDQKDIIQPYALNDVPELKTTINGICLSLYISIKINDLLRCDGYCSHEGDFLDIQYIPSIKCVLIDASLHLSGGLKVRLCKLAVVKRYNYYVALPENDLRISLIRYLEQKQRDIKKTFSSGKISIKNLAIAMQISEDSLRNTLSSFDEIYLKQVVRAYDLDLEDDCCCVIS